MCAGGRAKGREKDVTLREIDARRRAKSAPRRVSVDGYVGSRSVSKEGGGGCENIFIINSGRPTTAVGSARKTRARSSAR